MASEFLSRLSNIQGSMFRNTIQAKALELVNNKVESTKNVVDTAASEMALLRGSASMKSIDEQIEELSGRPEVISGTQDIADLSKRAAMLSQAIAEKQSAEGEIYNKVGMSLGVIGGDSATRALNAMARQQGLTNKELDAKVDAIDLQVKRQSVYTSAVINTKQLKHIESDEETRRLVSVAKEYFLANVDYRSSQDFYIEKSDKDELEAYEANKSGLIEGGNSFFKNIEPGMTREILEQAYGVANLYTEKFSNNRGSLTQEDIISLKDDENTLKTYSNTIMLNGGIEAAKDMLINPSNYDSVVVETIQGILKPLEQGGLSPYDTVQQRVMTRKSLKGKDLQQEFRAQADEKGAVLPPEFDVSFYSNGEDYYAFNGQSINLRTMLGGNPEVIKNRQKEIDDILGDKRDDTFGRVETDIYEGGIGQVGGGLRPTGKYMTKLLQESFTSPDDLKDWQKISNAYVVLKNDEILDELQIEGVGGFKDLERQRKEIYNKRIMPITGQPKPYVKPSSIKSNSISYEDIKGPAKDMALYEDSISKYADLYDVNHHLVRSIIFTEGRDSITGLLGPDVKSHTNTRGITQVTEDTFNLMLKNKRIPKGSTYKEYVKNSDLQIQAGVAYLDYLKDYIVNKVGMSPEDPLYYNAVKLAYNAGEGRAKQLIDSNYLGFLSSNDIGSIEALSGLRPAFNKKYKLSITQSRWDEVMKYVYSVNSNYVNSFINKQ